MTHQATEMLIGTACGLSAIGLLILIRVLPRPHADDVPAPLPVLFMAYRYCPDELRTRAVIVHPDGTATCGGCHTHIPATEG
jgi:hypothetical protein